MTARLWILLTAIALSSGALAQDVAAPSPAQADLIDRYAAAIKARDVDAVKGLYHPAAFECVNERNAIMVDATVTAPFALTIPDQYQSFVYPADESRGPDWMRQLYQTAVPFSHQLQLHLTVNGRQSIITQPMVETGGEWRLVLLCLSDLGVEWYELARTDPATAREKAKAWATEQAGDDR